MAATEKTISGLIASELPDFIKADHPQFKRFVELYYTWLEQTYPEGISNTAGNTVYQAMNIGDYRDIDQSPDEFITYFKQELLPRLQLEHPESVNTHILLVNQDILFINTWIASLGRYLPGISMGTNVIPIQQGFINKINRIKNTIICLNL